MNTLVLCTSGGRGGLELYALRVARFIVNNSDDHCVLVTREDGYLAAAEKGREVNTFYLQWRFRALPLISALKLARYIDVNKIDVIHMHWGKDLSLAALAKHFSRRKPKLLYTRHMGITRPKKDLPHRFLYSQVDRLLTISKQVRKEALEFLPLAPDKIQLLYLGVPPAKVQTAPEREVKLPGRAIKRAFNIGMFGRIEHGKGQHLLVDAVAMLVEKKLDVSATIIGHVMDENYFDQLKQTIEKRGLAEHIEFVDFIDEPMAAMPAFDVITLTTYCEAFGLVLVEAMRAGVAVIGTDAGGVPEIIRDGETGFLVPPGDSAALAERLQQLYENSAQKEQLALSGKAWADTTFDEETNFSGLMAVFHDLAAEAAPV